MNIATATPPATAQQHPTKSSDLPIATLVFSAGGSGLCAAEPRDVELVEVEGREYRVVAEPVRWFERVDRWWEERGLRLPKGIGAGVIDQEILRLEVQRGSARSQITTMELVRGRDAVWRLRAVLRAA